MSCITDLYKLLIKQISGNLTVFPLISLSDIVKISTITMKLESIGHQSCYDISDKNNDVMKVLSYIVTSIIIAHLSKLTLFYI